MAASFHADTVARLLPQLDELCHDLPKVDLHRHLTGSLQNENVRQILKQIAVSGDHPLDPQHLQVPLETSRQTSTAEAWELLERQCGAVKVATESSEANLRDLVAGAITNLAQDNVMYCEFRVGPKIMPTKRHFVDILDQIIKAERKTQPSVDVRLLLSMNRACDPEAEAEHVRIAIEHLARARQSSVCGVEVGGPAEEGHWAAIEPHCTAARAAGLGVVLHCGESWKKQAEWTAMIDWRPDRLGHCVYLDRHNKERLLASGTPVETAITCHDRHFGVQPEHNVFNQLYPQNQVVLSTDNPSFYGITLSAEYALCCRLYGLTVEQLVKLARRGIDFALVDGPTKVTLRREFDRRWRFVAQKYRIPPFELETRPSSHL